MGDPRLARPRPGNRHPRCILGSTRHCRTRSTAAVQVICYNYGLVAVQLLHPTSYSAIYKIMIQFFVVVSTQSPRTMPPCHPAFAATAQWGCYVITLHAKDAGVMLSYYVACHVIMYHCINADGAWLLCAYPYTVQLCGIYLFSMDSIVPVYRVTV